MPQRSKREPILDDPETLKMVKDEFAKLYPNASLSLEEAKPIRNLHAWSLWHAFCKGFEAGYWADEIPLHSG